MSQGPFTPHPVVGVIPELATGALFAQKLQEFGPSPDEPDLAGSCTQWTQLCLMAEPVLSLCGWVPLILSVAGPERLQAEGRRRMNSGCRQAPRDWGAQHPDRPFLYPSLCCHPMIIKSSQSLNSTAWSSVATYSGPGPCF